MQTNINSQLQEFQYPNNLYYSTLPIKPSNTLNYDDNNSFPLSFLKPMLSLDLQQQINSENFSLINEIIHNLSTINIPSNTSPYFNNLIFLYQPLIFHLNSIKQTLETKITSLNNDLTPLTLHNNQQSQNKSTIQSKSALIKQLNHRYKIYQTVLNAHSDLISKSKRIYFCDICPNMKFTEYKQLHNHYTKEHINPDLEYHYLNYRAFYKKIYYESKIDDISNELKYIIEKKHNEMSQNLLGKYEELYDYIKRSYMYNENRLNSGTNQHNLRYVNQKNQGNNKKGGEKEKKENENLDVVSSYNKEMVYEKIKILQEKHMERMSRIMEDFDMFKREIFNQLLSIQKQKQGKQDNK